MGICNSIVSVFRGYDLASHSRAMLSPLKAVRLSEGEAKWLDIQKALSVVLCVVNGGEGHRMERLYHALSIGCVLLIKKYSALGGLYVYVAFWTQLTALFGNVSRVMSRLGAVRRERW